MEDSNQENNIVPKFDILPFQFKKLLRRKFGQIEYDNFRDSFESELLDCINDGLISVGNSPLYNNRIEPDVYEFDVWYCVIRGTKKGYYTLVYLDEIEKYQIVAAKDIEWSIAKKDKLTIIKDPIEMLSTMVRIKKENYRLFGKLPYLGKQNNFGRLLLFEEEIIRPDYTKIKSNRLISLKNCMRILIGIDNLSLIAKIQRDLTELSEFDRAYESDWMTPFTSFKPEKIYFQVLRLTFERPSLLQGVAVRPVIYLQSNALIAFTYCKVGAR